MGNVFENILNIVAQWTDRTAAGARQTAANVQNVTATVKAANEEMAASQRMVYSTTGPFVATNPYGAAAKLNTLYAEKEAQAAANAEATRAQEALNRSQQTAMAVAGGLGAAIGFMLIPFITKLTGALTDAVFGVGNLAKSWRDLRIEAEEVALPVEDLAALNMEAQRSGIQIGQLRQGMRMLVMNVERHPEAFKALGVSVRDASGEMRPLHDILSELMDVIAGVSNEGERMALVSALMGGRLGTRLIPMLLMGSEGFKKIVKEAQGYGLSLDELAGTRLTELAKKQETTNLMWQGAANTIKLRLLPAQEAFSTWLYIQTLLYAPHSDAVAKDTAEVRKNALEQAKLALLISTAGGQPFPMPKPGGAGAPGTKPKVLTDAENMRKALNELLGKTEGEQQAREIEKLVKAYQHMGDARPSVEALAQAFHGTTAEVKNLADKYGMDVARMVTEAAPLLHALQAKFGEVGLTIYEMGKTHDDTSKSLIERQRAVLAEFAKTTSVEVLGRKLAESDKRVADLNRVFAEGGMTLQKYRAYLDWIGKSAGDAAEKEKFLKDLMEQKPIRAPEPTALTEDERAAEVFSRQLDYWRQMRDEAGSAAQFVGDAFGSMYDQLTQGIDTWMAHVFATKSAWGAFWRALVETALQQLTKLLWSKVVLFLLNFLGMGSLAHLFGGATAAVGGASSTVGVGAEVSGIFTTSAKPALGPVTNNNITVQTFSPRDVIGEYLSPAGVLRRAQAHVQMVGEG